MRLHQIATCLFIASFASLAGARDAFVMLSGGISPFENNYSQYLQARAVTTFFQKNYPPDSVWVFFGAGNITGEKSLLGDVLCVTNQGGNEIPSWIAGSLPRNLPGRRDVVLRTFREEILPAIAHGGTLYLFVGDHGEQSRGTNAESIINLWELDPDPAAEHGWRKSKNANIGVAEFRKLLSDKAGNGRVVFCMTQCHSGGFHHLAVPREMAPNPKWFIRVPDWAKTKEKKVFPRAAGFTATDELSPAAGCVSDPAPDNWAGYERFFPENLLGLDLFTLKPTSKSLPSFAEAHIAAILADETIDKPRSTSEQYLERWANLIETRLANETALTSKMKQLVAAYKRATDGSTRAASDTALHQHQALVRRFTETMCEQNPRVKNLLLNGTRKELETAIGRSTTSRPVQNLAVERRPPPRRRGTGRFAQARKLWNDTVRPAWQHAVESNHVSDIVPPSALDFERHLLKLEARGSNFVVGSQTRLLREVFWESGYADPETLDEKKADAIARWASVRSKKILVWAKTAKKADVRTAGEKLWSLTDISSSDAENTPKQTLSRKVAAERVLFYRRILAAWEFLLAANERPALDRLNELIELERTPLPRALVDALVPGR